MIKLVLIVLAISFVFIVVLFLLKKKRSYSPKVLSGDLHLQLTKTRSQIFDRISSLISGRSISKTDLEKIEEILISSDIGVSTTGRLMGALQNSTPDTVVHQQVLV